MAIETTRGWVFDDDERAEIKRLQRQVRPKRKHLEEQLRRCRVAIPHLEQEAQMAAQPYLACADRLLAFDGRRRGRKYQPRSLEDAIRIHEESFVALCKWEEFLQERHVQEAIRAANAVERKRQGEVNAVARTMLTGPELVKMLADALRTIDVGVEAISLVKGIHSHNMNAARRLGRVLLLRVLLCGSEVRSELRRCYESLEPRTMTIFLLSVVPILLHDRVVRTGVLPSLRESVTLAVNYFAISTDALASQGVGPAGQNSSQPTLFMVSGCDCSLSALPD